MGDSSEQYVRTLAKSGGALMFGFALQMGLAFFAKLLIARYLGKVDYGIVTIGVTTLTIAAALTGMNLHSGIGRLLPRYDSPDDRRGVVVSAVLMGMLLSFVVAVALFLGAEAIATLVFHDPQVAPVLRIFSVIVPFAVFTNLAIGTAQGKKESWPKVAMENVVQPLVRFVGVAVAAAFGLGILGGSFAYALPFVVTAFVGAYYLVFHTTVFSRGRWTPMFGPLLSFSVPLLISSMMGKIVASADIFLIGYFIDPGAVGVYNVVYPLAQLLNVGVIAFGFVFLPLLSELHAEQRYEEMDRIYQISTKWMVMITLPIFLVVAMFPKVVINLTFGPAYSGGATTLSLLAVGFFVIVLTGLNSGLLSSVGETRFLMIVATAGAALNLGLNVALIPTYSYFGAGVATTLSFVTMNAVYLLKLYTTFDLQPFSRSMLRPTAVATALMLLIYVLATGFLTLNVPVLMALFLVFLLGYGVAILRFGGIEEEEVMLVLSFEERFGVDLGPFKSMANRIIGD